MGCCIWYTKAAWARGNYANTILCFTKLSESSCVVKTSMSVIIIIIISYHIIINLLWRTAQLVLSSALQGHCKMI